MSVRYPTSKATWEMTSEEMARAWAAHYGLKGNRGGWIHASTGPLAQGWFDLGRLLERLGVILPGRGIDWAAGFTPERVRAWIEFERWERSIGR